MEGCEERGRHVSPGRLVDAKAPDTACSHNVTPAQPHHTYTESMNLSLKELKERTEAERQKNVIAVRARHLLVEVSKGWRVESEEDGGIEKQGREG